MTPWQVIEETLAHMKPRRTPLWLAERIGVKIQVVSNWKSRGVVPPARYRGIASALGITVDQLEGLQPLPWETRSDGANWPLSSDLHQKVVTLSDEELYQLEIMLRAHFGMPQISVSHAADVKQFPTTQRTLDVYRPTTEVEAGQMEKEEVPASRSNGSKTTHRPSRKKGRSGA